MLLCQTLAWWEMWLLGRVPVKVAMKRRIKHELKLVAKVGGHSAVALRPLLHSGLTRRMPPLCPCLADGEGAVGGGG